VSWSCDRGSLEGTLSIGSDPSCDWTGRGPGIAPLELAVHAPEGRLQVKSLRPGMGAKLDGEVLGPEWATLEPGSRLEFGFACIALEFDAAPLTGVVAHEREVPLAFLGTPLPAGESSMQANDKQPFVAQSEFSAQPAAKSSAKPSKSSHLEVTPQAISGNSAIITQHLLFDSFLRSLEARSEQLREWLARAGEQGRARLTHLRKAGAEAAAHVQARAARLVHDLRTRSTPQQRAKPAAKVAKPRSRRTSMIIYSIVFALTAFAYTYWLLLLDRM
jgi:hypothetical protein